MDDMYNIYVILEAFAETSSLYADVTGGHKDIVEWFHFDLVIYIIITKIL